jgi:hypothetical protein
MRRQILSQSSYEAGYVDSLSPIASPSNTWAAGSFGTLLLGDNFTRPFKGFSSQGAGSGTHISAQVGSTWGGLASYSTVTGQGSIFQDYNQSLFLIGAGKASREGAYFQDLSAGGTFTFVAGDVTTGTGNIHHVAHGLVNGQPIYLTTSGTLPMGLGSTTAYFVIRVGADDFKLATTFANAVAGTAVTGGSAGTGTQTVHYGADITASTVLQAGSNLAADYFYSYVDDAGLNISDAPTVAVPAAPSGSYTGLINGAVNFKIAAIRDRANTSVNIDSPDAAVKGRASSATAVVVPANNTVQITFPTAQAGQTHWAVFSTQVGFGGTGDFYRLGYRTSSTGASATWYYGISETTVAAATGRTLEFDYRTGDLLPETAWIEDYAPDAGTHAVRLENILVVLGCFNGTIGEVSLPNFFESFNPFHKLYFPEAVTGVMHRQVDDYAMVSCRNSIYALQYVGYRGSDLPAATITTVSPEVGIANQNNWALGAGYICMFIEGAGLALMDSNGSIDFEFGKEVAQYTKDWTAAATVITFNPTSRSFVCGNGDASISWCVQNNQWSMPVYNADTGTTGSWVSGTNAKGKLWATLTNGGVETTYAYDDNTGTTRMPTCSISQWQSAPVGRSVNVYEGDVALRQGNNVESSVIGFHTNLFKTYIRGCSTTSASSLLTAPANTFSDNRLITGMLCAAFGLNIGNRTFNSVGVNLGNNSLTVSDHIYVTGQSVTLTTVGTLPSPLVVATTYYIIVVDANTIKLASSLANAYGNSEIVLSTIGSGTSTLVCNFLIAKLNYSTSTQATLTNRSSGNVVNAGATLSNVFVLVGRDFFVRSIYANAEQFGVNTRPAIQNARAWATSVFLVTDASIGQVFSSSVFGVPSESSVVNVT